MPRLLPAALLWPPPGSAAEQVQLRLAQVADALTVAVAAGESHSAVRAFHALIADGRSAGRRLGPVQEDRA